MLPDFRGVGRFSLRQAALTANVLLVLITGGILAVSLVLLAMVRFYAYSIFVQLAFFEWHAAAAWTMWLITVIWGFIAIGLPARPRAPKRAAILLWVFLIFCHMAFHTVYICVLCWRCHNFFRNTLAGNIMKNSMDTLLNQWSTYRSVRHYMYAVVPIANIVSAPYVFRFLHQFPPLDIIFYLGWSWAYPAFVFGVIPLVFMAGAMVIGLGYMHAIDRGGNGTEKCPPSRIALFYSLHPEDRADIRRGIKKIEDFYLLDEEADLMNTALTSKEHTKEDPGGSDYSSENGDAERGDGSVKRIPSYKPKKTYGTEKSRSKQFV